MNLLEIQRRYYEGRPIRFDVRIQKALEMFPECNGLRVLDLGCQDGLFSSLLMEKGYECYGIDITPKNLKVAKKRGVKVVLCDIGRGICFPDNFFDAIFAGEIIEHIVDTDFVLQEIRRVLKDTGFAVITLPNAKNLVTLIAMIFLDKLSYLPQPNDPHVRCFTYLIAKQVFENNGFKIVDFSPTEINIPYILKESRNLRDGILSRISISISTFLAKLFPRYSAQFIFKVVKRL